MEFGPGRDRKGPEKQKAVTHRGESLEPVSSVSRPRRVGVEIPPPSGFIRPCDRVSEKAIESAQEAHDLALHATDLHGKLRERTMRALKATQGACSKDGHGDVAFLHDGLAEDHRKMAGTYQHIPGMAHTHQTIADLHLRVKECHRVAMGLARAHDFETPEATDAFYLRKYGETHPLERQNTDKLVGGTHKIVAGVLVERLSLKVDVIPEGFMEGFIDRTGSPADEYYPKGVMDDTLVAVVINHNGKDTLHVGQAQSFGWNKAPATPAYAGLEPVSAPITHYKILEGERHGH